MYGNGGVLEIRPSGRGAETTGKGGAGRRRFLLISINLIEVVAMVMTAYVMIDMKGEIPRRRGEAVLMRADNEAAVTWVRRYRGGGKKQARAGALMRIMGAWKQGNGGVFRQGMCGGWRIGWQTVWPGGKRARFSRNGMQNVLQSLGRCRTWERGSISCVRRYCERLRIWKSCSFDSKDLRGELEDVGELAIFYRERVLAKEGHGGDGADKGIGRVHGILLRREGEQGVDHSRQVGGDQFLP